MIQGISNALWAVAMCSIAIYCMYEITQRSLMDVAIRTGVTCVIIIALSYGIMFVVRKILSKGQ